MDKWLRNVNVVRVVALLVGIMLWVVVHNMDSSVDNTTTYSSPIVEATFDQNAITTKYDQNMYYISELEPENVQLLVKGKGLTVNKLKASQSYKIVLDLTNLTEGEHDVKLGIEDLLTGLDFEIIPQKVRVKIEKLETREFSVQVNIKGIPSEGFIVSKATTNPEKIIIKSTLSKLNRIDSVIAEISVDKQNSIINEQVSLKAYDNTGKYLDVMLIPQQIKVTVPISPSFKTLPVDITIRGEPLAGYAIESMTIVPDQIIAYGSDAKLRTLTTYKGLEIDITNITESKEFELELPQSNEITKIEPRLIKAQINIGPSTSKNINNIPIKVIGQNEKYSVEINDPQSVYMNILVEGASSILYLLEEENIEATINVNDLSPGQHRVEVTVVVPDYIKILNEEKFTRLVEIIELSQGE